MHAEPSKEEFDKAGQQIQAMHMAFETLRGHVEATYGLFMDSRRGWERIAAELHAIIADQVRGGMSREQAMQLPMAHGEGPPDLANVRHVSTFAQRLAACSAGGFNEVSLSGLCLVSIYSHWEDRTRGELAKALRVEKGQVKAGLFADVNRMRNALLHAGGRLDSTKPFEVLKWFKKGDVIVLTPDRFHELTARVREFPQGLHLPAWEPFNGRGTPILNYRRT